MDDVLFVLQDRELPSSRVRALDLGRALLANGVRPTFEYFPSSFWAKRELFRRAADFPVTVLQKRLLRWVDFTDLRTHARRLVFDFDDAIYCRCASPSKKIQDYDSPGRRRCFARTVAKSDVVVAANHVLAGKANKYVTSAAVRILPSSIVTEGVAPKSDYRLQAEPVLGWVGTSSTQRYLDLIREPLIRLQREHGCVLHVVSDAPYDAVGLQTRFTPWNLSTQYDQIRRFDIGIMPLSADPFSEGKASFKLLQYLACGVPSVASAVGMNIEVSDGERNCLLAETPDQMCSAVTRLLRDLSLREELARNGRGLVERSYTSTVVGTRLAGLLKQLL
jgi:glycosyltransferase involved in cell wall biosynthesis